MWRGDEADGALQVLVSVLRIHAYLQRHNLTRSRRRDSHNMNVIGIATAAIHANQIDSTIAIVITFPERA